MDCESIVLFRVCVRPHVDFRYVSLRDGCGRPGRCQSAVSCHGRRHVSTLSAIAIRTNQVPGATGHISLYLHSGNGGGHGDAAPVFSNATGAVEYEAFN